MARPTHAIYLTAALLITGHVTAFSHEPDRGRMPVRQRIDVIGPLGNRLEPSMRRVMNRPTYLGGRLAHIVAPSSQEAMAWHNADHLGAYKNECPRIEPKYFYPKPWEALKIGPRVSLRPSDEPTELRSLQDISLTDPTDQEPDEFALPADRADALRDDVIGSGVDEDAVRSESDRVIDERVDELSL